MAKLGSKCPICEKEIPKGGMGGHLGGHTKRGEKAPGRGKFTIPGAAIRKEVVVKPEEVLDPREVASELLTLAVGKINEDTNYNNQISALKEEILDLEGRLKKAIQDKENVIKINNEIVKQSSGKTPTVKDIVSALLRNPDFNRRLSLT